jgi:hypothetical protein
LEHVSELKSNLAKYFCDFAQPAYKLPHPDKRSRALKLLLRNPGKFPKFPLDNLYYVTHSMRYTLYEEQYKARR